MRTEVVAAFRHLVGPPEPAKQLAPYVDAVDGPLAAAIAGGAAQTRSDDSALLPNGTSSVSTIKVVAPGVATVDFSISDQGSGGYQQRFVGNVVLADGRWKISWATVCMLVEAESYVCPNPPASLPGAVPLPRSLSGEVETAHQEPDLLRPQALAIEPDGDLLIVDSDRDQILRWQSDGHLSIFAGTGQPGLAGVGGPAVDARLPVYFGSQLAVAKDGTSFAQPSVGSTEILIGVTYDNQWPTDLRPEPDEDTKDLWRGEPRPITGWPPLELRTRVLD